MRPLVIVLLVPLAALVLYVMISGLTAPSPSPAPERLRCAPVQGYVARGASAPSDGWLCPEGTFIPRSVS